MSEQIYDNLYLFTTDERIEFIGSLFNLMNIKPIRKIMGAIAARSLLQDMPANWNLTFTSAGKTGRSSPNKKELLSFYDSRFFNNSNSFDILKQGYQKFTVWQTGLFQITVYGAGSFDKKGFGAIISGQIELEDSEKINITQWLKVST